MLQRGDLVFVPRCVRPTSATDHSSTCTHYESSFSLRRRSIEVAFGFAGSLRVSRREVWSGAWRASRRPTRFGFPCPPFASGVFGQREVDPGFLLMLSSSSLRANRRVAPHREAAFRDGLGFDRASRVTRPFVRGRTFEARAPSVRVDFVPATRRGYPRALGEKELRVERLQSRAIVGTCP